MNNSGIKCDDIAYQDKGVSAPDLEDAGLIIAPEFSQSVIPGRLLMGKRHAV
ncbi:MAG: hypothetical protein ACOX1G_02225 [bacterium]